MKTQLLLAGLLTLSTSMATHADSYVSLAVGQADISFSGTDENSTSFGGNMGYQFSHYFAVELSYLNYDRVEVTGIDFTLHSYGINFKAAYPIHRRLDVYAKAGYANVAIDAFNNDEIGTLFDTSKPVFGTGVSWDATQNVELIVDFSTQQTEGENINNIALGLQFNF